MKAAFLAGVLFAATVATAQADGHLQTYAVQGSNLDGSTYSGTAVIEPTSADTCHIAWQTGSTSSEGFCMRSGNILTAAYILGEVVGLVIYRTQSDGSLQGVWTVEGRPGVGSENLTPVQ